MVIRLLINKMKKLNNNPLKKLPIKVIIKLIQLPQVVVKIQPNKLINRFLHQANQVNIKKLKRTLIFRKFKQADQTRKKITIIKIIKKKIKNKIFKRKIRLNKLQVPLNLHPAPV